MIFNKEINVQLDAYARANSKQIDMISDIYNELKMNNGSLSFFTDGGLDAINFIYYFCSINPLYKSDVLISTFGLTEEYVNKISLFKRSGLINRIKLVIHPGIKSTQPKVIGHINQVFDEVVFGNVHAKVITITNGPVNFTIISSMNLTRNNKCEAGIISLLPEDFFKAQSFLNSL